MAKAHVEKVVAINDNSPRGQKTIAIEITYVSEIQPNSVSKETYRIGGRNITSVEVKGKQVVIHLNPQDDKALTRKMIGFGPDTKTKVTGTQVSIWQKKSIKTTTGNAISGFYMPKKKLEAVSPIVDEFKELVYQTENGQKLIYHLYEPKIKTEEKLPLVLFMHDSSVCSKDTVAPLLQGMGGLVWAYPQEQEKRPCYVLVPQYPEKSAFDDFTVTWVCEATVQLLQELCHTYNIDATRIYGTGQSMGCMMLCELNIKHPELFAASYMVAGQWNPAKMAELHEKNLWILISEKDEKAFPIMTESVKLMEEAGAKIARGSLNAKASVQEKEKFVQDVLNQNGNIQFTYYEGESNLPEGMKAFPGCFHLCTWLWSYDIEPIREWMFSQKKKG